MNDDNAVDDLQAVHVVRIRALASVFRVETSDAAVAERLAVEWSRCLVERPVPGEVRLPIDRGRAPMGSLTYTLASTITRRAIEAAVGRFVMFHACGLVDDAGRTAVLVAPSGTGKTTAAATLARENFGYLTDEAVAVSENGTLLPYPKPLSVVQDGGGKAQFGPDELGLSPSPAEPRLGALVLLNRVQGTDTEPDLERVPLIDGVLELLSQTSALPSLDRPLRRLLEVVDHCGGVYRLTYSEIAQAATSIRELLAGGSRSAESWASMDQSSDPVAVAATHVEGTALVRGEVSDAVQVGDETLALRGTVPVRLSGIGTTIWREAHSGSDLAHLIDTAVRENGPHPNAEELVREAVRAMIAAGLLREEAKRPSV